MTDGIYRQLSEKGLKVTPQRIAVLEAINRSDNHPTADDIIGFISKHHPSIGKGTVYRVLDTLTGNGIIGKVKTDSGVMRYDPVMSRHHHLYCTDSERIEDYSDEELNKVLDAYFKKKKIKGFIIDDLKLQLIGRFRGEGGRNKSVKDGKSRRGKRIK